jgi:hypothetical protein
MCMQSVCKALPDVKPAMETLFSGYRRQQDSSQQIDCSRGGYPHTGQAPAAHLGGENAAAGSPGGPDAAAPHPSRGMGT